MLYFWLAKLLLWVVYYLLRLIPVAGMQLSDAYSERVIRPVADDIQTVDVHARLTDADPASVVIEFTLENDSKVDADVEATAIRVGLREDGGTLRNVVWPAAVAESPANIEIPTIPSEGETDARIEFLADGHVETGTSLVLDGSVVFEYSFELRGHRFSFGQKEFPLSSITVDVE